MLFDVGEKDAVLSSKTRVENIDEMWAFKLKAVLEYEVCLIINVCVTLYAAFSMLLWLISVPDGSVNTAAACGLIIRRSRIICQDD